MKHTNHIRIREGTRRFPSRDFDTAEKECLMIRKGTDRAEDTRKTERFLGFFVTGLRDEGGKT